MRLFRGGEHEGGFLLPERGCVFIFIAPIKLIPTTGSVQSGIRNPVA